MSETAYLSLVWYVIVWIIVAFEICNVQRFRWSSGRRDCLPPQMVGYQFPSTPSVRDFILITMCCWVWYLGCLGVLLTFWKKKNDWNRMHIEVLDGRIGLVLVICLTMYISHRTPHWSCSGFSEFMSKSRFFCRLYCCAFWSCINVYIFSGNQIKLKIESHRTH